MYSLHRLNQGELTEWTTGGEQKDDEISQAPESTTRCFQSTTVWQNGCVFSGLNFHCFPTVGMAINLTVAVYIPIIRIPY